MRVAIKAQSEYFVKVCVLYCRKLIFLQVPLNKDKDYFAQIDLFPELVMMG
jgi:hypothetical protein